MGNSNKFPPNYDLILLEYSLDKVDLICFFRYRITYVQFYVSSKKDIASLDFSSTSVQQIPVEKSCSHFFVILYIKPRLFQTSFSISMNFCSQGCSRQLNLFCCCCQIDAIYMLLQVFGPGGYLQLSQEDEKQLEKTFFLQYVVNLQDHNLVGRHYFFELSNWRSNYKQLGYFI